MKKKKSPYGLFFNLKLTIMIKDQIKKRGLKLGWVAKQLGINPNSFRVYLSNENMMPEDVRVKIKDFLKKYNQ